MTGARRRKYDLFAMRALERICFGLLLCTLVIKHTSNAFREEKTYPRAILNF